MYKPTFGVLMNHLEPEGARLEFAPRRFSQIYNTDVANIFSRHSVEPGPVPNPKASICAEMIYP
jgi:hypothetical protein